MPEPGGIGKQLAKARLEVVGGGKRSEPGERRNSARTISGRGARTWNARVLLVRKGAPFRLIREIHSILSLR